MFKFLSGTLVGWTAARTINPNIEIPWKPPTYDECVLLGQKAKQAFDNISKKLEELDTPDEESTSED